MKPWLIALVLTIIYFVISLYAASKIQGSGTGSLGELFKIILSFITATIITWVAALTVFS